MPRWAQPTQAPNRKLTVCANYVRIMHLFVRLLPRLGCQAWTEGPALALRLSSTNNITYGILHRPPPFAGSSWVVVTSTILIRLRELCSMSDQVRRPLSRHDADGAIYAARARLVKVLHATHGCSLPTDRVQGLSTCMAFMQFVALSVPSSSLQSASINKVLQCLAY